MHSTADRAKTELTEAKAAAAAATLAANKLRGGDGPKARSAKASEMAAIARVRDAAQALTAAEGKAVTESTTKADDRLMPVALELVGTFVLALGFGLGRDKVAPAPTKPAPVETATPSTAPVAKQKDPKRVEAGRKAAVTRAKNKAIVAGKVTAIK
jgi:hypothetical protein